MKIVHIASPKFLTPILRQIFKIKTENDPQPRSNSLGRKLGVAGLALGGAAAAGYLLKKHL